MQPTRMDSNTPPTHSATTPLLSVRHLKTHFPLDEGLVVAVDDVSFDLYAGQTLGIVGESGCGKSVTARSILGILDRPGHIVEGEILFRRRRNGAVPRHDEVVDLATFDPNGEAMRSIRGGEIALVFQEPMTSFSPVHTIGNQLVETIMLHRTVTKKEAHAMAIESLRQVGISAPKQRIDEYSFQLSGGLRQRAMIAMALSCQPSILIADEPTTALDVTTQAQILDLMRTLQRTFGMAIMLITHDLGVIAEMADHVIVMYLGQVVESAPADEIFHAAKHPYTQALLQSIPRLQSTSRAQLATITGTVPHPYARPPGCPFHPRCLAFMEGICDVQEPTVSMVEPNHTVCCFLYNGG